MRFTNTMTSVFIRHNSWSLIQKRLSWNIGSSVPAVIQTEHAATSLHLPVPNQLCM